MNIREKLKNKDNKTLIDNFISLSALQLVGMILPLITLPYVLRVLGFENYGLIIFVNSLILYFQSLTDFSFKITAVRDVAIFKHSPKKLNIIYSKVLTVKSLFLLISLLIIFLIVVFYPPFYDNWLIYFLSSLSLIGYVLFPEWFFQGIEKMRMITYLNLGIKVFFTLCIFIFIKDKEDYWIYPLLQGLGLIGAGFVGQYLLMTKYNLKFYILPIKFIKKSIRTNFPIFINQFVPTLYNNTSIFLLGILSAKEIVGVYNAILTVINLVITIIDILSRVFFPFLNRKKESFNKYRILSLVLVSTVIALVLIFNKLIFLYLDIKNENAIYILLILLLGLYGYSLSKTYGLNYFIVHNKDRIVMNNTIMASIIGFILAYPLIKYWSIIGAALTLTMSRCFMGFGLYIKYLKYKK